mmetsp:Transcript_35880/g.76603  ORF Transcript_35880/g.76603 Transcript_35880/m.76603 type:complete len:119 (+) Transcript_35880:113-469(+)
MAYVPFLLFAQVERVAQKLTLVSQGTDASVEFARVQLVLVDTAMQAKKPVSLGTNASVECAVKALALVNSAMRAKMTVLLVTDAYLGFVAIPTFVEFLLLQVDSAVQELIPALTDMPA